MRTHYFNKHEILKKGKIEKQPCPKTDKMYKEALAASNLQSGGTIFNMIEGLEKPTHDSIGRPLVSDKRKRALQESANNQDSEDEDIPLALLAGQSGGQLPWEEKEPEQKKRRRRKKNAGSTMVVDVNARSEIGPDNSQMSLVPIEDPPSVESQQASVEKRPAQKKETKKPTRRSGRAKTVKSYIEDLDEDEENDEELLDILNAAQQKLNSKAGFQIVALKSVPH